MLILDMNRLFLLLFLSAFAHAGHFSCDKVNTSVAQEQPGPWEMRPDFEHPPLHNFHALAKNPGYAVFFKKLGAKILPDGAVRLPSTVELNANLEKIGSSFTIESVKGEIPLRPWLDLIVDRKLPVGDPHDLMTHALATFLMPPDIASSFQTQIGTLLHIRDELNPPAALQKFIDLRIRSLAFFFENHTFAVGAGLVKGKPVEHLGVDYFGTLNSTAFGRAGAGVEVQGLDANILGDWKNLGFSSKSEAQAFSTALHDLHERDKKADPRYGVIVTKASSIESFRQHVARVLAP